VSGDSSGASLSGDQILQGLFKQSSSENMWANLGAVFGYVVLFRCVSAVLVDALL
jgi:CDR ABC transporter